MTDHKRLISRTSHIGLKVLLTACLALPLSALPEDLPLSTDPQVLARQKDVYDVVNRYQDALNTKSTDTIVSLFADESVAEWNNKVTYATRQQKIDGYNALFKNVTFKTSFAYDAIDVYDNVAIVRTHHHVDAAYVEKGKKVVDRNREVFVLRQAGGQWKIIFYMFNTDPKQGQG